MSGDGLPSISFPPVAKRSAAVTARPCRTMERLSLSTIGDTLVRFSKAADPRDLGLLLPGLFGANRRKRGIVRYSRYFGVCAAPRGVPYDPPQSARSFMGAILCLWVGTMAFHSAKTRQKGDFPELEDCLYAG